MALAKGTEIVSWGRPHGLGGAFCAGEIKPIKSSRLAVPFANHPSLKEQL